MQYRDVFCAKQTVVMRNVRMMYFFIFFVVYCYIFYSTVFSTVKFFLTQSALRIRKVHKGLIKKAKKQSFVPSLAKHIKNKKTLRTLRFLCVLCGKNQLQSRRTAVRLYVKIFALKTLSLCYFVTLSLIFRNCCRHCCSFAYKHICHQDIFCIFVRQGIFCFFYFYVF